MGEEIYVAGTIDETPAELERVITQTALAVSALSSTQSGGEVEGPEQMEQGSLPEPRSAVGCALLIDQKRERDTRFFAKGAGVLHVSQPNGRYSRARLPDRAFVLAQLRDMLPAEDSSIVAKKNNHGRRRVPERSQSDLISVGIGQGDIGERRSQGFRHNRIMGLSCRRWQATLIFLCGSSDRATQRHEAVLRTSAAAPLVIVLPAKKRSEYRLPRWRRAAFPD